MWVLDPWRSGTARNECGNGRQSLFPYGLSVVAGAVFALVAVGSAQAATSIYGRALSDEAVEYLETTDTLAPLAAPIVIFGDPYLEPGNLDAGFEIPTGAVWQPSLWMFGQGRTALQVQDTGDAERLAEWANTLDLFFNLQLSGTERFVVGINPLRRGTHFTGYRFSPDEIDGSFERFGANLTTLFFEGDFGELFPELDPTDELALDYGFAIGRQSLSIQQDLLVNDTIDGVGIVRNSLVVPGGANGRITGFYGWNEISRADTENDQNANMWALFTQADFYTSTVAFDLIYVPADESGGDGLYFGGSAVQRFGLYTTSFRAMTSQALDGDTAKVSDGLLLYADVSTTPESTDDIVYATGFAAFGEFTQAARDPTVGGPLTRAGILFASPQLGIYEAPLSPRANDVLGFAAGRQWFLTANNREQAVLEFGGRKDIGGTDADMIGIAGRYQIQIHNNALFQFDLYGSYKESDGAGYGTRTEILFRF
jgi:hypothetical protein